MCANSTSELENVLHALVTSARMLLTATEDEFYDGFWHADTERTTLTRAIARYDRWAIAQPDRTRELHDQLCHSLAEIQSL